MLEGGEDPRYLARRILRMAVEDIGLADPEAVKQCLAAWETYERLGSPEGELAIAQKVEELCCAILALFELDVERRRDDGAHQLWICIA